MSRPSALSPIWVSVVVLAALGLGWISYAGLAAVSRPARLGARLDQIDAAAAKVDEVKRAFGGAGGYQPLAICRGTGEAAAEALRRQLQQTAAVAGLVSPSVQVTPPDTMDVTGQLTPILFEVDATGGYDAALTLLRRLAQGEPQMFADTLDLKSQTSNVELKLTGRVLCWPSQG